MGKLSLTRVRWHAMKDRCDNPANHSYKNYGAKGITYPTRWENYDNFLSDMGVCPVDWVMDRMDNNLGYHPQNCRWVPKGVSSKNRRTTIVTFAQASTIKMLVRAKNPETSMLRFAEVVGEIMGLTTSLVRDIARGKSWQVLEFE